MTGASSGHGMNGGQMTTFQIVFDGGSKGNPGKGYGSYKIFQDGKEIVEQRLTFDHIGNAITNNQAEYMTLIHALERLAIDRSGSLKDTRVEVMGDSLLVINQVGGSWKIKNEGLRPLRQRARTLVDAFGEHSLKWHDRSNSVKILGH
ncbi:ribonuclease HI family protein [soil metagenome]